MLAAQLLTTHVKQIIQVKLLYFQLHVLYYKLCCLLYKTSTLKICRCARYAWLASLSRVGYGAILLSLATPSTAEGHQFEAQSFY